jgi:hypothetical protein
MADPADRHARCRRGGRHRATTPALQTQVRAASGRVLQALSPDGALAAGLATRVWGGSWMHPRWIP